MRLDVFALRLAPEVFQRLKTLAGSRMTAGGEIVLTARRFRTQESNRAAARDRLAALIAAAHRLPEKRAKTRVTRLNQGERLEGKKRRAAVKVGRGKVTLD